MNSCLLLADDIAEQFATSGRDLKYVLTGSVGQRFRKNVPIIGLCQYRNVCFKNRVGIVASVCDSLFYDLYNVLLHSFFCRAIISGK